MKSNDVVDLVKEQLWPLHDVESKRLAVVDQWYRWDHPFGHVPRNATTEHRKLIELSKTPWLGLVVSVLSQAMFVDGYRSPDEKNNASIWRTWQGNKFDARQVAIHRAALAYGYSFATALPGIGPDGTPMARLRGASPLSMQALYAEPAEDDFPMYAIQVIEQPKSKIAIRVYDEEFVYFLGGDKFGAKFEFIEARPHGAGVTPVVRYANMLDLEGRAPGEVEPFIPVAARINKTDYDRLLTQHFASWKVRYIAGLTKPDDADEASAERIRLRQDEILVAEDNDTKFGTLDATDLAGFITAHETDIQTLAAVSQTPTFALTGDLINLSADALAAARSQLDQKVNERKVSFGESHASLLRLGAYIEGDTAAANDVLSRVTWQDTSIRSLSAAADGLGKIATQLQVPVEALWSMIPGVTRSDIQDWKAMQLTADPLTALQAMLAQHAEGGTPPPEAPPAAA